MTETTSRAVSRLQADGLIEIPGRQRIRLCDTGALARVAAIDPGTALGPEI